MNIKFKIPKEPDFTPGQFGEPFYLKYTTFPNRIINYIRRDQQIKDMFFSLIDDQKDVNIAKQNLYNLNNFYGTDRFENVKNVYNNIDYYGFDQSDIDENKLSKWENEYYKKDIPIIKSSINWKKKK